MDVVLGGDETLNVGEEFEEFVDVGDLVFGEVNFYDLAGPFGSGEMGEVSLFNAQVLEFDFFTGVICLALVLKISLKGVKLELLLGIAIKRRLNPLLSICKFLWRLFTAKPSQYHSFIDLKDIVLAFLDFGLG